MWEILKHVSWDFAGGPVVDCAPKAGGPGLMPGQGARSCTPQVRVLQLRLPSDTTERSCDYGSVQQNKSMNSKKYKLCLSINRPKQQKIMKATEYNRASHVAQLKNLPAMQETRFRLLGWEDPLQNGMATHSSILAWEIPWTEEPGRLQPMRLQESDTI